MGYFISSCQKTTKFDELERHASTYQSYVDENRSTVQGEWRYFMDNLRGNFTLFLDDEQYYSRFILGNNDYIKTEILERKGDTLFVADPVGKYYVLTKKGHLNVFFEDRTITTLMRK